MLLLTPTTSHKMCRSRVWRACCCLAPQPVIRHESVPSMESMPLLTPTTTVSRRIGPEYGEHAVAYPHNHSFKTCVSPEYGEHAVAYPHNHSFKTCAGPKYGEHAVAYPHNHSLKICVSPEYGEHANAHPHNHSFKTCVVPETLTPTTILMKCQIKN